MPHCPAFGGTLRRWNTPEQRLEAVPSRCGSWLCPYCRVVNARRLRHRLMAKLADLPMGVGLFGTLTSAGTNRSAAGSYAALHRVWPTLRQWIRRHYGPFEYLAIYERHADGAYHMHWIAILPTCPPSPDLAPRLQRQIKDKGPAWGVGYIADVRPIKGGTDGLVRYVSKQLSAYLTKGTQSTKDGLPKGARLYYMSRGLSAALDDDSQIESGFVLSAPISIDLAMTVPVFALSEGRYLDSDDFSDDDFWPSATHL